MPSIDRRLLFVTVFVIDMGKGTPRQVKVCCKIDLAKR